MVNREWILRCHSWISLQIHLLLPWLPDLCSSTETPRRGVTCLRSHSELFKEQRPGSFWFLDLSFNGCVTSLFWASFCLVPRTHVSIKAGLLRRPSSKCNLKHAMGEKFPADFLDAFRSGASRDPL